MSFPPPQLPAAPPQPNYTVRTILIIVAVIAVGAAIFINRDKATTTEQDTTRRVVYTVTGSRGDVTMQTPNGTVQQQAVKGQVGAYTFGPGDFVYLSVQNANPGSITCTIKVDGLVISTNTATGRFSIASCEGSA